MAGNYEQELKAEIESFRAEVAEREERRARNRKRELVLGAEADPFIDPDRARDLIAQRYENARLRKRLEAAERRIAELESRGG